jgi:hypothetical protein
MLANLKGTTMTTEWLVERVDPNNNYEVEARWLTDTDLILFLVEKEGWKVRKSREVVVYNPLSKLKQFLSRIFH